MTPPGLLAAQDVAWLDNTGGEAVDLQHSQDATRLVDGATGPDDSFAWASGWRAPSQYPISAYIDLKQNYDVSRVRLFAGNHDADAEVELSYTADTAGAVPQSWTPLTRVRAEVWNTWVERQVAPVQARYIRLTFQQGHKFNVSEVQFAGTPSAVPAPGSSTANDLVRPYTELFQYGVNPGYYGNGYTDEKLYELAANMGVRSVRPALPDFFLAAYGTDIRKSAFNYFYNTLNFRENTLFVEGPRDPRRAWQGKDSQGLPVEDNCDHATDVTYGPTNVQCKLWAGIYEPSFVKDATGAVVVNPANKLATYLEEVVKNYGQYVRFYEIINEPDFVGDYLTAEKWCTQAPTKEDLSANINADVFHYIRALRVSYEVIKKLQPDAYVAPGGVGYACFTDALLRYTDNPDGGKVTPQYPLAGGAYFDVLSYHSYPQFGGREYIGGQDVYSRHSDRMVSLLLSDEDKHRAVLKKYGYDGSKYPAKPIIVTETNIPRKAMGDNVGGDEVQRNFMIKALVKTQQRGTAQLYIYSVGESKNAGDLQDAGDALNNFSGLYENLTRDAYGTQKATQEGVGVRTTSGQLLGYRYDPIATQALNLPPGADGAAFRNGWALRYVLWAKTTTDLSEAASSVVTLPGTYDVVNWDGSAAGTPSGPNITLTSAPQFFTPR